MNKIIFDGTCNLGFDMIRNNIKDLFDCIKYFDLFTEKY